MYVIDVHNYIQCTKKQKREKLEDKHYEHTSSNNRIAGFVMRLLAIATLCFCPPESLTPRSPTSVS